jgi:hypothetical protein
MTAPTACGTNLPENGQIGLLLENLQSSKAQMQNDTEIPSVVQRLVDTMINFGTADEAMTLMTHLRDEAQRLDRHLADPRHQWNRID